MNNETNDHLHVESGVIMSNDTIGLKDRAEQLHEPGECTCDMEAHARTDINIALAALGKDERAERHLKGCLS